MHALVRGRLSRHLYATIAGFLLQLYMFREGVVHVFLMTAVTYLMMNVLPRTFQHKAVFVFVMAYLSGSHIYRMITNFGGWDMDITTYTMILTAKLSALAFCYKDGGLSNDKLLKEQVERKVVEMPSVLEMASYVLFCCSCICGPFFEYSDYIKFIEERDHYKDSPSTFLPSIKAYLQGHLCLGLHLWLVQHFWGMFCGTPEFADMTFLNKVGSFDQ